MKVFKWYRRLKGGVWQEFVWFAVGKEHREWRRKHNGRWCEYEARTENYI